MTRRHDRAVFRITLRTLKWGTLAVALFIAGVWVGGERTALVAFKRVGKSEVWVHGHRGGMQIYLQPQSSPTMYEFWNVGRGGSYIHDRQIWTPSIKGHSNAVTIISIPYWLPILLFATISYGLFRHDRRTARRAKIGMCPSCGYSRAGLALDAVCPECGKAKV